MKILGILFLNILLGLLFVYIGGLNGNDFLDNFLKNQILPISSTILGFNIAGIIFLLSQLSNIEIQQKLDFSKSKVEIKHNIYLMGIIFFLIFFLLLIDPTPMDKENYNFLFKSTIMTLFFLMFYALYEVLNSAFHIKTK